MAAIKGGFKNHSLQCSYLCSTFVVQITFLLGCKQQNTHKKYAQEMAKKTYARRCAMFMGLTVLTSKP